MKLKPSEYPLNTIADINGMRYRKSRRHWVAQQKYYAERTFDTIDAMVAEGFEFEVIYLPVAVTEKLVMKIQSLMASAKMDIPDADELLRSTFDKIK